MHMHMVLDTQTLFNGTFCIVLGFLMLMDIWQERGWGDLVELFGDKEECRFPFYTFLTPLPLEWMYVVYLIMCIGKAAGLYLIMCIGKAAGPYLIMCIGKAARLYLIMCIGKAARLYLIICIGKASKFYLIMWKGKIARL